MKIRNGVTVNHTINRVQDIRWMSVLHRLKRSGDIENLRSVELTELFRARDASCPKGKKMEIEVNLTNRNLEDKAYEKQKDNYRNYHRNNNSATLERCFYKLIKQHGRNWNRNMFGYIFWYICQLYFFKKR